MSDVVVAVLGGLSGLLMAVAAVITAARRATAAVQEENRKLQIRSARERRARDKAGTVIYQLLGVAERGEPYTD